MAMTSVSRSSFSRTGTVLTMKPGVTTLSVGTISVTGITIDENYSIDVSSDELTFTNGSGTRTVTYTEDLISGGLIKPELMPDRALTQIYKPADETALLVLDPIQIGDIAINQATDISYVALNGDNADMGDWEALALASTHDAVNVTSALRTNWTAGYDHSIVTTGNPHSVTATEVSAVPLGGTTSLAGDIIPTGATSTYDLGSSSKYFKVLYASAVQLSTTSSISSNYGWDDIGSFLTASPSDSTGYTVYIKSEVDGMLGGGSAVDSMNLLKSTGSFLKVGRDDSDVQSADVLGSIHFTSTDTNVIEDDDTDPNYQLENTHAKILAKTTGIIYNTQDGSSGGTLNPAGTWQTDANIEFQTGFDALNTNFRVNSDNSIALPLYDWGATSWVGEPISETNFLKIFANSGDKSLYYSTGTTGQDPVRKQLVVNSDTADGNALSVNFNIINSVEIDTGVLKIGGKVIDLDNIITSFDTWSQNTNSIEVNGTASSQTFAVENITVNQITADTLIPSDATLLNITVLLRWRLTSNSHETEANTIQSGLVQIKRSDQVLEADWKTVRSFTASPGSYYTPENTSTAGDMIVVDSTYTASELMAENTGIRDLLVNNSNVIFNMRIKDITSEQEKLILRDLSWGIRLYWR